MKISSIIFLASLTLCAALYGSALFQKRTPLFTKREASILQAEINGKIQTDGFVNAYKMFMINHPDGTIPNHIADHFFGSYLYAMKGISGISECSRLHGHGCEHSVYLSDMLSHHASGSAQLLSICSGIHSTDACWHAFGHAAALLINHGTVETALSLCKKAPTEQKTLQCVNGIFMQHFKPALFLPESTMPMYRQFIPATPYDICTTVPDEWIQSCIEELVAWWRPIFFNSYTTVSLLCNGLPDNRLKSYCYTSMGAEAAYDHKNDSNYSSRVCDMPQEVMYKEACIRGVQSYSTAGQNPPMQMN